MNKFMFFVLVAISFMGVSFINISSTGNINEVVPKKKTSIDYFNDIKPILDKRCVTCHSCYNSPCQLKLSSYEGLDRGASKKSVYGARLTAADPTRLFIDANSTPEWRQKEFFSVTDTGISEEGSLAMLMLEQKRNHPKSEGFYISEKDLTCSETEREIKKFFSENPHKGMPYGFPQLQEKEHAILMKWLGEGAQKTSSKINTTDPNIEKWETFLNAKSTKSQVMARYIYEHLFIAHIYFPSDTTRFYELIRSNTPPNQPIDIVATRYPFDTPEDSVVYYRLREITSTIVDKTHMPYEFSDNKMARYKSLFLAPKWNKKPYMPSYQIEVSANPFLAYDQIPANSRHNFLLDNAYFFMSTFIKGPVCKGQTALNVIHDHLWIMFLDPKYDLSVQNDSFLLHSFTDLTLPNQVGSYAKPAQALFGTKYGKHAVRYYKYRDNQYSTAYPNGMNLDFLWKDNEKNSSLLTVYRHFDSGSVHKGALGDLPRTLWVVDFPVLERIYYSLVAGFDVFSGTTQQVMIREYMNRLRIESESNFLDFLPEKVRKETFDSWYLGTTSKMVTNFHTTNIETAVKFETNNYKEEFASLALKKFGLKKDPINYSKGSQLQGNVLKNIKTKKDLERAFSYLSQSIIPSDIIAYDIEYINLAHMRIKMENGEYLMYSMVVNRWHNNVSFLLNEDLRLDAEKDRLNFIEGFIGSYPNIYFDIEQSDLADFFDLIANYDKENEAYYNEMRLFSINRSNPKFWEVYDWFQNKYNESDRLNSGLFDLNRYYPHAR